jgi:hypothetical protein
VSVCRGSVIEMIRKEYPMEIVDVIPNYDGKKLNSILESEIGNNENFEKLLITCVKVMYKKVIKASDDKNKI